MNRDREILRELAKRYAEAAALPVMEQTRRLWRNLNGLRPERPMVLLDQVCWNEMDVDDELILRCENGEARSYEWGMRAALYNLKHMPADMVIEPFITVYKAIDGLDMGVNAIKDTLATDPANAVVSKRYHNQFTGWDDLEKIRTPVVTLDKEETARRLSFAHDMFDGVLDVRESSLGHWGPFFSVWDNIAQWMGVENALYALADEPEFMRALADRLIAAHSSMLDQLEEQNLVCGPQSYIHCTGAWTDELPAPGYDPARPRLKDIWTLGLAQMFSNVSPAMFDEFEIEPNLPVFGRFGLVYYGCCDPLDGKMNEVKKIKNVRKISASPWVNQERMSEQIGKDYVFSRKPNPALLAWDSFDEAAVRNDLTATRDICRKNGCPLEFILKDISTVRNDPRRLWSWAQIAKEVALS